MAGEWKRRTLGLGAFGMLLPSVLGLQHNAAAQVPSGAEKGIVVLEGEDVSDIVRLEAALRMLASSPEFGDVWLRNRGIDPESRMARELFEAAVALDDKHPLAIPAAVIEDYRQRDDDAGFLAFQRERSKARYAEAGRLFGEWAARRQQEGYALGALIDRLCADRGLTMGSNDPDATRQYLDEVEAALREGARRSLPELPAQLRDVEEP
jgi:hypothetical protein